MSSRSLRDVDAVFWGVAETLLERPGVTRSTMMGYPCLRFHGDFFASWDRDRGSLVVKLDRTAVAELIAHGPAEPFAPSGRPFREWASIPSNAKGSWPRRLDDAFDYAVRRSLR